MLILESGGIRQRQFLIPRLEHPRDADMFPENLPRATQDLTEHQGDMVDRCLTSWDLFMRSFLVLAVLTRSETLRFHNERTHSFEYLLRMYHVSCSFLPKWAAPA